MMSRGKDEIPIAFREFSVLCRAENVRVTDVETIV
jgi:hypothetical protein